MKRESYTSYTITTHRKNTPIATTHLDEKHIELEAFHSLVTFISDVPLSLLLTNLLFW